jgi:hypothetical protein
MKPQDLIFFSILAILLLIRKPKLLLYAGLACILFSIPLFAKWVFFTAERLIWYAYAFLLIFVLFTILALVKDGNGLKKHG